MKLPSEFSREKVYYDIFRRNLATLCSQYGFKDAVKYSHEVTVLALDSFEAADAPDERKARDFAIQYRP